MRALAAAALVAACVYVGFTYPILALTALFIFAAIGTTYELLRKQP